MDLRDLHYFRICAETGHLSRAAEQLHLSQPAVTQSINRLERDLGHQLLYRPANRRKALQVTEAGRLVLQRAANAMAELDTLREELSELAGMLRGTIHLAGIQSLNLTLMPQVLAAFAADHPQIEVQLHTHPSSHIADELRDGRADIGIIAAGDEQDFLGLEVVDLYQEDFVVIVRHDDELAGLQQIELKRIAERDLLLVSPDSYSGAVILNACAEAGFEPPVRLVLESGEALRECVRAGLGLSILPRGYLTAQESELRAVSIVRPKLQRRVLALHSSQRQISRAAAHFLTTLQEQARKL